MKPFLSQSPEQTEKFAAEFSKKLKKGDVIALCGDLGSGKTTFVRGLFYGLHGDPAYFVTSPTFTLLHEYPTKKSPLYHFDLYRIETFEEFQRIDFEEYFGGSGRIGSAGTGVGDGICVVEWGDKIPELASEFDYKISFRFCDKNKREIVIV
ncbi:MAG: tRNA (adenosine(37)-N6)-threonylcarbamoyltransferase complex ATPase subunit type 1 TsaE [Deltaproteobacteria bacterium]|nr:tRNA (adenosine(37)-N6)-threonylcarbamoyltransferase complex ATPase subunit type 1 TsaE [Deltaproteobacteria bacterium]